MLRVLVVPIRTFLEFFSTLHTTPHGFPNIPRMFFDRPLLFSSGASCVLSRRHPMPIEFCARLNRIQTNTMLYFTLKLVVFTYFLFVLALCCVSQVKFETDFCQKHPYANGPQNHPPPKSVPESRRAPIFCMCFAIAGTANGS